MPEPVITSGSSLSGLTSMNFVWLNRTWPLRPVSCSRVQRSRIPSVSSEPTAIVTSSSVSNRISSSTVKLYSADKLLLRRFARRALEGYSDTDIRDMEAEDAQGVARSVTAAGRYVRGGGVAVLGGASREGAPRIKPDKAL